MIKIVNKNKLMQNDPKHLDSYSYESLLPQYCDLKNKFSTYTTRGES
ncbi:hypothetical protein TSAR_008844 [Trichomalopsis sarcophagae]|uniref:Uncharacterized protein n=1 Tax=Trichomalopsis sarcophagae TaxID=543379 RepID=A0A232END7_9HYME|nr:hypothetical protein TSAR_008844 [Trichomalopsis sarcophagae]